MPTNNEKVVDVAIIGAKLAGLSAAKDLKAGKSVVILEARNRLGGRVFNVAIPRYNKDKENDDSSHAVVVGTGAEFVGPTRDRVLQLARD